MSKESPVHSVAESLEEHETGIHASVASMAVRALRRTEDSSLADLGTGLTPLFKLLAESIFL